MIVRLALGALFVVLVVGTFVFLVSHPWLLR